VTAIRAKLGIDPAAIQKGKPTCAALPPFLKECNPRFPRSQIVSNLTKFIHNIINIYITT
jgi:hypothetical protein